MPKKSLKRLKKNKLSLFRNRGNGKLLGIFALLLGLSTLLLLDLFSHEARTLNNRFCANSVNCINDLTGKYKPEADNGIYMGKQIRVPKYQEESALKNPVLGANTGFPKHIYVDLTDQRLYAYEGDSQVYDFPVSTGKWSITPTGDFHIWSKLRYTGITGGSRSAGTYYNLPNVPFVMLFYNGYIPKNLGYGIYGAYWHNNFGHPMGYGGIEMNPEDAGKIFNWTDPDLKGDEVQTNSENSGTPVTVYGTTPGN